MRLLDRYLLREVLIPLVYCLCGFMLLWVTIDLFTDLRQLRKGNLFATDIALYYLVKCPEFLVVVLPVALLLALLYAVTNHARHHEITAIRAAGIGLFRISLPYLVIGFLASAALFALNELWVPDSAEVATEIRNRRKPKAPGTLDRYQVQNLGFANIPAHRVWQIGLYDARTGHMTSPQVVWTRPDGSRLWLKAEQATYTNGGWLFFNVRQYQEAPQTNSLPVPVLQTNLLHMALFDETPAQIKSEIKISNTILVGKARKADLPLLEILDYLRLHPNPSPSDRSYLYTKLHARIALPWTCLIVVLIAIPFGAASGRRNVYVGVASSMVICFSYFVVQQLCLALGARGDLEPWLAGWLPNLAFGLAGVVLTARVR